jgi:hypothetical protein
LLPAREDEFSRRGRGKGHRPAGYGTGVDAGGILNSCQVIECVSILNFPKYGAFSETSLPRFKTFHLVAYYNQQLASFTP